MGKLDVLLSQRTKLAKSIEELSDHLIEVNRQIEAVLARAHSPQPFDVEHEGERAAVRAQAPTLGVTPAPVLPLALARVSEGQHQVPASDAAANSDADSAPVLRGLPRAA